MTESDDSKVRLDKWLWAARFYKTRSLAAEAIAGGKVQVNGERVKRAKPLQVGDEVRIRLGPYEHQIVVRELSERRGPAPGRRPALRGEAGEPGGAGGAGLAAEEPSRRVRAGAREADQEGPAGDRETKRRER